MVAHVGLAIGRHADFRETWIAKIGKTFDNSYLLVYIYLLTLF
jgi:hypothetical protein